MCKLPFYKIDWRFLLVNLYLILIIACLVIRYKIKQYHKCFLFMKYNILIMCLHNEFIIIFVLILVQYSHISVTDLKLTSIV